MSALTILGDAPKPPPVRKAVSLYASALEFRTRIISFATMLTADFAAGTVIDEESDALINDYLSELREQIGQFDAQVHTITAETEAFEHLLHSGQLDTRGLIPVVTQWMNSYFRIYACLNQLGSWVFKSETKETLQNKRLRLQQAQPAAISIDQVRNLKHLNERVLFLEILLKKTRLETAPPILVIDPTSHCNYRCRHCAQSVVQDYMHTYLSPSSIGKIAPILPRVKEAKLFGTGEATLSPFLPEIIELTHAFGCRTEVQTNGSTLGKGSLDFEKIDHLGISFDGACKRTFETLRVGSNFKQLIERIKELRKKSPSSQMYFAVTVSRVNLDEISDIIKWAGELGIQHVYLNKLIPYLKHFIPIALRRSDQELFTAQLNRGLEIARTFGVTVTNCISLEHEIDDQSELNKTALLEYLEAMPVLKAFQPGSISEMIPWVRRTQFKLYPQEFPAEISQFLRRAIEFPPPPHSDENSLTEQLEQLQQYHDSLVSELKAIPAEQIVIPYCTSPWVKCFVEAHSGIRPCDPWTSDIASLQVADTFKEMWNSPDLVQLRSSTVGEHRLPEKCQTCTFAEKHLRADELLILLHELGIDISRVKIPEKFNSLKELRERYAKKFSEAITVEVRAPEPSPAPAPLAPSIPAEPLTGMEGLAGYGLSSNGTDALFYIPHAATQKLQGGPAVFKDNILLASPESNTSITRDDESLDSLWLSGTSVLLDTRFLAPHTMHSAKLLHDQLMGIFRDLGTFPIRCVTTSNISSAQSDMLRALCPTITSMYSLEEEGVILCENLLLALPRDRSPLVTEATAASRAGPLPEESPKEDNITRWQQSNLELRVEARTASRQLNGLNTLLQPQDIIALRTIGALLSGDAAYVEVGEPTALSSILVGLGMKMGQNVGARAYAINQWGQAPASPSAEGNDDFFTFLATLEEARMDGAITPLRMSSHRALSLFPEKSIDALLLNLSNYSPDDSSDITDWFTRCKDTARVLISSDGSSSSVEALAIEITRRLPCYAGINCKKLGWLWELELLKNNTEHL